jgi:hypothetical protein
MVRVAHMLYDGGECMTCQLRRAVEQSTVYAMSAEVADGFCKSLDGWIANGGWAFDYEPGFSEIGQAAVAQIPPNSILDSERLAAPLLGRDTQHGA